MKKPLLYLEFKPKQIPYVNGFDAETIQPYILNMEDPRGFYGLFNDFDTVFEKTYNVPENEKFYYPVIVSLWQFIDVVDKIQIPDIIVDRIKKGQCKILITCPYEGWAWEYWDKIVDKIREKYTLKPRTFVMMTGSYRPNLKCTSVAFNYWEKSTYQWAGGDHQRTQGVKNLTRNRKNKFICLNRRPHPGRFAAVTLLNDLKDQGILTCAASGGYNHEHVEYQYKSFYKNFPELVEQFKKDVLPNIPMVYDDGINPEIENPALDRSIDKFYDSYLYIVTETFFYEKNTLFLSEKIFKPIVFFQPFIVIGRPGTLRLLRRLGYKTFHPFIDESYDNIKNDRERMFKAIDAARALINMSPEELTDLMIKMESIFYHNYLTIQKRSKNLLADLSEDLAKALK